MIKRNNKNLTEKSKKVTNNSSLTKYFVRVKKNSIPADDEKNNTLSFVTVKKNEPTTLAKDNFIASTCSETGELSIYNDVMPEKGVIEGASGCGENCKICFMEKDISPTWRNHLESEFKKSYFIDIKLFLHKIPAFYPPAEKIFTCLSYFPVEETKVVIIGQDPYHNANQATGLSFSVPVDQELPPSLKNIYKELSDDLDINAPTKGCLKNWAKQGVLLLNDVLTVTPHLPSSHSNIGWKIFTSRILEIINEKCKNVVFMLWGKHAQAKASFVDAKRHLVLQAAHPSPFSAVRFFGCRHFSRANKYLANHGKAAILWNLS